MDRDSNVSELLESSNEIGSMTPTRPSVGVSSPNTFSPALLSSSSIDLSVDDDSEVSHVLSDYSSSSGFTPPRSIRSTVAHLERINRIYEDVNQDLQSVGIPLFGIPENHAANSNDQSAAIQQPQHRNTNVVAFVDLSESHDATPEPLRIVRRRRTYHAGADDDDVIVVGFDMPQVVDLCTPGAEENARRRSTIQRSQLSRRSLNQNPNSTEQGRLDTLPVEAGEANVTNNCTDSKTEQSPTNGNNTKKDAGPLICPVCMESCLLGKPTSTNCGHVFCEACIMRTVQATRRCPICNKPLDPRNLFRLYV